MPAMVPVPVVGMVIDVPVIGAVVIRVWPPPVDGGGRVIIRWSVVITGVVTRPVIIGAACGDRARSQCARKEAERQSWAAPVTAPVCLRGPRCCDGRRTQHRHGG